MKHRIEANIVDIDSERIYKGEIVLDAKKIFTIREIEKEADNALPFAIPGFIDAHVHIESSMMVPSEFAKLAVVHGTVATVSDPHEIANVCGIEGIDFMIENGRTVPFKFYFGAPSCVPATTFETAGAAITATEVEGLLKRDDIYYLSEVMNYPGVIYGDEDIWKKLESAKRSKKPIDGHAPGLRGEDLKKYLKGGISTDHECFTKEEALEKLSLGVHILIREGSAAKNFEALIDLLHDYPDKMMFCSDDKHPDSLVKGHINELCERAIKKGINVFKVLKAACINPIKHYHLNVGALKEGDPADFILVEDLSDFKVLKTFINGDLVSENGVSNFLTVAPELINNFNCSTKRKEDFEYIGKGEEIHVIEALDGQLITNKLKYKLPPTIDSFESDLMNDILKIVVINRYHDTPISIGFVKNMGLTRGAIASSVAHDSHNIIAVGVDDESLCRVVNSVINARGGIVLVDPKKDKEQVMLLELPIGGLMSKNRGNEIAELYTQMDNHTKTMGSELSSPFMTLSFLALLVIPHLKISDKGLFDADHFQLIN